MRAHQHAAGARKPPAAEVPQKKGGPDGGEPGPSGSAETGGRPAGFDSERHKKRNTVERAINRLKGLRAVAIRYEKRAYREQNEAFVFDWLVNRA